MMATAAIFLTIQAAGLAIIKPFLPRQIHLKVQRGSSRAAARTIPDSSDRGPAAHKGPLLASYLANNK